METLLTAIVPAFALIAIGYGAARLNILGRTIFETLNKFVYYLAMPALLIASLATVPAGEILNWNYIAAFTIGIAVTWIVVSLAGRVLFRDGLADGAMRGVIASYGNNGYLGIPLVAAAFGEAAIVPASLSVLINSVVLMTGAVLILEFARASDRRCAAQLRQGACDQPAVMGGGDRTGAVDDRRRFTAIH